MGKPLLQALLCEPGTEWVEEGDICQHFQFLADCGHSRQEDDRGGGGHMLQGLHGPADIFGWGNQGGLSGSGMV